MFRKAKAAVSKAKHEVTDNTDVVIHAHNRVQGVRRTAEGGTAGICREVFPVYQCKSNAELKTNFLKAAIQCGVMTENEMGDVREHAVDLSIEGKINGQLIAKTEFKSVAALSDFIKSHGVETGYLDSEVGKNNNQEVASAPPAECFEPPRAGF